MTTNGLKWLEMAPKVLHNSNKKAKRCKKGARKVFFKELNMQKNKKKNNGLKWLQMAPKVLNQ